MKKSKINKFSKAFRTKAMGAKWEEGEVSWLADVMLM